MAQTKPGCKAHLRVYGGDRLWRQLKREGSGWGALQGSAAVASPGAQSSDAWQGRAYHAK
jgi:hypothetical protein